MCDGDLHVLEFWLLPLP